MFDSSPPPICSIVIPAFNEEAVIGTTLETLLEGALENEFEIIVACNGCVDATAKITAIAAPSAKVIISKAASKTTALNQAIASASHHPIVFLDADIKTSAAAVRKLTERINRTCAYLAYGSAKFETKRSSWAVRTFYKAWQQNPYFDRRKMGGFFAISKLGLHKLGPFPDILSDDEYVRRNLIESAVWVCDAPYTVQAPRTLWNLIKVRSRVYRGNRALEDNGIRFRRPNQKNRNAFTFMRRLIGQPSLWLGALIFALTVVAAHSKNRLATDNPHQWDRDTSTRTDAVKD